MRNNNNHYTEKILQIITEATEPLDAENVRIKAGIKNWQTCLKHLLELTLQGKIEGTKTSKSWIFWAVEKGVIQHEQAKS